MGIRLLVVDDNPHVTWDGRVYPVNATFQQFVAAVLDVPGSPVASVTSAVPLRAAASPPATLPLDPRIRVVGTEPFDGIAGYLRSAPRLVRANRPILRRAMADADLLWLKVPASNAALAAALAARAGVQKFGYVAGSARHVARGRGLGVASQVVGLGYDIVGRLASGRVSIVVGQGILDGDGIVSSLVEPHEIRDRSASGRAGSAPNLRLAWAGRVAAGKGLEALLDAVATVNRSAGVDLLILGDGPSRDRLAARARELGIEGRVEWRGYVAARSSYLDALASSDLFVFPSPAEGFPKVVLDAMAVGLPVLASRAGELGALVQAGVVASAPTAGGALAAAIQDLASDGAARDRLRARGLAFARRHTRPAEAARLLATLRAVVPDVPWGDP